MSEPISGAATGAPLQFDTVEHAPGAAAPGAMACAACRQPISDVYHQANGQVVCSRCRAQVEAQVNGAPAAQHYVLAVLLGAGAAVLGGALYLGIALLTGYELGLVAIAVGWLVGKAVWKGSGQRGGTAFQAIAAGFTYLSILTFYVPAAVVQGRLQGLGSVLFLPFTQGASNIIGIAILGFGVFEAWRLNVRPEVSFTGPHRVAASASEPEAAPALV